MMHVVICVKQVLDPEIPPTDFMIDSSKKKAAQGLAGLVISTFDECAVETALLLRERSASGAKITVITLGDAGTEDVLRHALAMGCDEAIRIEPHGDRDLDSLEVAELLAAAIRGLEPVDLVLFGRESGDWGCGHVGPMVAELLGRPLVIHASTVEQEGDCLRFHRFADGTWETVQGPIPMVATVTNSKDNVPRFPSVRDKMLAVRKPVRRISAGELHTQDPSAGPLVAVEELFIPQTDRHCYLAQGATTEQQVADLVAKMKELKVL